MDRNHSTAGRPPGRAWIAWLVTLALSLAWAGAPLLPGHPLAGVAAAAAADTVATLASATKAQRPADAAPSADPVDGLMVRAVAPARADLGPGEARPRAAEPVRGDDRRRPPSRAPPLV